MTIVEEKNILQLTGSSLNQLPTFAHLRKKTSIKNSKSERSGVESPLSSFIQSSHRRETPSIRTVILASPALNATALPKHLTYP